MYELRVTGFGGQGIIRTGMIIGKALSLYGGMNATLTQAFGPEARGSACSAQVVIDGEQVLYPYVTQTDFLVAMSQEGYTKFRSNLRDDGTLLIDKDLVIPEEPAVGATAKAAAPQSATQQSRSEEPADAARQAAGTATSREATAPSNMPPANSE